MLLYISEPELKQRIAQVNAGDNGPLSADAVTVRIEKLAKDFFAHVGATYLLVPAGFKQEGNILITRFNIQTVNKEAIYNGLSFIAPVALTVEKNDLKALVPHPVIRLSMEQSWPAIAPNLDRITVDELHDAVERSAKGTVNHSELTVAQTEKQEREALAALAKAGVKDPLDDWNRRDKTREAEEDRLQNAQRWLDGPNYEEPATPDNPKCAHGMNLADCQICWSS